VGSCHVKPKCLGCARARRPRVRLCLRKGCGRKYQPRSWNQLYCQDPECLCLVRRWQAARRQAKRRLDEAAKARHAQAQRARRQRPTPSPPTLSPAEVPPARGHAAKILLPTPWCDRPGCYELPPKSRGKPACFCCPACRRAVRRVRDRERKWLCRGTFKGRQAREREYAAARARRSGPPTNTPHATPSRAPPS
jgi:hypothetical protein